MCVLASAVDIVILTHREAVISNSWSPPRFVLYEFAGDGRVCNVCIIFVDIFAV